MQNAAPEGSGAVPMLGGVEQSLSNKTTPTPQPATVHQVRALHLIGSHHVRPELAITLGAANAD